MELERIIESYARIMQARRRDIFRNNGEVRPVDAEIASLTFSEITGVVSGTPSWHATL
jgi:hypothetical protein